MKLQDKIPEKWNFGKHMAFVGAIYATAYAVSNIICFLDSARKRQKSISDKRVIKPSKRKVIKKFTCSYVKNPPKSCKIVNAVITAMMCIDLASYPIVKKLIEKRDW